MFEPHFPYAGAMSAADSVHPHFKVRDVDELPHERIEALATTATNAADGYLRYPFRGGINMIFSSIPISEDDMLPDAVPPDRCVLDHKGVDLRRELPEVKAVFDAVPSVAAERGRRHVAQGGDGNPVYCCHTEVLEKHWIFRTPVLGRSSSPSATWLHDAKMGCDLRPIDPAHPRAAEAQAALAACAAGHADDLPAGGSYYEPADLGKFTEVGRHASEHMQRFWSYYNGVFGTDGALTVREKALIGLALAHAHQCPYCIDSFSSTCTAQGIDPNQMHEAVHASAAGGRGATRPQSVDTAAA